MRLLRLTQGALSTTLPTFTLAAILTSGMNAWANPKAGTVAIVEGHAFAQKGAIYFTRPRVGGKIRVNEFGQYNDSKPFPAFVKWTQNTRRHLKANDVIEEGDIIQTAGNGWLKILFEDDSLLDVGPASVLQVRKFSGKNENRRVYFKMLYGRVRSVVTRKLAGPQKYQLATPNALTGVRGTEYLVNVFPDKDGKTQTEVVCLHGQVSVDIAKHTDKGLVYHQPVVINPGTIFSTEGYHGLGQLTNVRSLPQQELRDHVARLSPQVNVHGTIVGSSPGPSRLLGTGIALRKHNGVGIEYRRKNPQMIVSTFDMDHPPVGRALASPSGNFRMPTNLSNDPAAFGSMPNFTRYTGPPPISQLPTNTSRVTVRLNGI